MKNKTKNNAKTIFLIIVIIAVAIALIWFTYEITNSENSLETTSNVADNEVKVSSSEKLENTVEEEQEQIENKTENKIENDVKEERVNNNTETNKVEVKNTEKTTGATNEEKAINVVKKNWGSEEGVYFTTMGIDAKGRYIVTVNDSSNSAVYAEYYVNIETGEIEE